MAKAFIKHNFTAVAQDVIAVWYENSAPSAEIDRLLIEAPHTEQGFTADNLNPVMHQFKFYQSSDGVTLETLLVTLDIDASIYNEVSTQTFQYVVDRGQSGTTPAWSDPVSNTTDLTDERLDGYSKSEMNVVFRAFGPRLDIEYDLYSGGGISLKDGEQFSSGDALFISIYKNVATQAAQGTTSTTGAEFTGVSVINTNVDFDTDLYNKLIIADFSGTSGKVDFPALSLIPNNTKAVFNTHGGSQKYLTLQFEAGDTVNFLGEAKNAIYLAKGEELRLFIHSGVCYVVNYSGNAKIRGTVQSDINTNRVDTGSYLLANESTGVLSKADYPGIYEFILSLGTGVFVPLSEWSNSVVVNSGKINQATTFPNKCKYGIDTTSETFRVPHLQGLTKKFASSGQIAGAYTHDAVGNHTATVAVNRGNSFTGAPGSETDKRFGYGAASAATKTETWDIETGNTETTVKGYNEVPLIVL